MSDISKINQGGASRLHRVITDPVNIAMLMLLAILSYLVIWPFVQLLIETLTWGQGDASSTDGFHHVSDDVISTLTDTVYETHAKSIRNHSISLFPSQYSSASCFLLFASSSILSALFMKKAPFGLPPLPPPAEAQTW